MKEKVVTNRDRLANERKVMHLVRISDSSDSLAEDGPALDPKRDDDFAELVRLHHRELLVYARALCRDHSTASDIVQDAFVVAYEKVHTFDVTRDFATWMRGIVRNKYREWLRKNKRYELSDENLAQIDADIAAWQQERAESGSSLFDALKQCLDRLPENLSQAVHVSYYEGRTSDEAAEVLGIAPAAVRKRLQRARDMLKQCLDHKLQISDTES